MVSLLNKYLSMDKFSNYNTEMSCERHNLKFTDVPHHFHEPFIYSGYRNPNSSWRHCLQSLISQTNETVNIWTHLMPALYFAFKFYDIINSIEYEFDRDYYAPFVIYIGTIVIYTLISSLAHMFNTMSHLVRHVCFICDYVGVSVHIHGAALAIWAYSTPIEWIFTIMNGIYIKNFITLSILTCILSVILSSRTRFQLPSFRRKIMRSIAFLLPSFIAISPLILRYITCYFNKFSNNYKEDCSEEFHYQLSCQLLFSIIALIFYIFHLPECFFPGRFDIWGHSHQLFHIAGVFNTYFQVQTIKSDLLSRKVILMNNNRLPNFLTSYGPFLLVLISNIIVSCYFIKDLLYKKKKLSRECSY